MQTDWAWDGSDGWCSEDAPWYEPDPITRTAEAQTEVTPEMDSPFGEHAEECDPTDSPNADCIVDIEDAHRRALQHFHQGGDLSSSETSPRQHALLPAPAQGPETHGDEGHADYNPVTGGVTCRACDVLLNSVTQYSDHVKGKKHVKKLARLEAAAVSQAKVQCTLPFQ